MEIVAKGKYFPTFKELSHMFITFSLTVFAWIFFRAENLGHAFDYISGIFTSSIFDFPNFTTRRKGLIILFVVGIFMVIEWLGREGQFALSTIEYKLKRPVRNLFYYIIIISIIWFSGKEQAFIYFQF